MERVPDPVSFPERPRLAGRPAPDIDAMLQQLTDNAQHTFGVGVTSRAVASMTPAGIPPARRGLDRATCEAMRGAKNGQR